jgi:alpha-glucosidase
MWWRDAVIYQIYPRSFQDSDGDGIGDLRGILARLDHISELGADAFWLSPIYPSPLADLGYDVSDYEAVHPDLGTLADFDRLVAAAHERGLRVLLDLVPCHTSIEHPWFREHPDWYIWADDRGPPNNWRAAFGGPAWTPDPRTGRFYLHSFYPEQPDLDWRNPAVVRAFQEIVRFWLDRGVDGFRLDAIDKLLKDEKLRDDPPAAAPFPLPLAEEAARLDRRYSGNRPDVGRALAALRDAAGDALLVGEVYLPTAELRRYLEHVDLAFAFELLHSPWEARALRRAIETAAALDGIAWTISNHDFPRVATRFGRGTERAAAVLLLTLPGPAFVYQGEEIGLSDGPGADPPHDRAGRDGARHPMQWDGGPHGGFTTGGPWLPAVDQDVRNVEAQKADPDSILHLYRRLIGLRDEITGELELVDTSEGVLGYARGSHGVALNTTARPQPQPFQGEIVLATHQGGPPDVLASHAGVIVWRSGV